MMKGSQLSLFKKIVESVWVISWKIQFSVQENQKNK